MEKQIVLESNAEYEAFVDKFKPKLTTDDCYTPPEVYEVVKKHIARAHAQAAAFGIHTRGRASICVCLWFARMRSALRG